MKTPTVGIVRRQQRDVLPRSRSRAYCYLVFCAGRCVGKYGLLRDARKHRDDLIAALEVKSWLDTQS